MPAGLTAELPELIALQRYAKRRADKMLAQASYGGSHLSRMRGRGMDFAEVRNYQSGDEVRHMDWRVTARTGKPHVKLYEEERERPVILCVDFSPSMYFGTRKAFKSVVAVRLAAMLAWTIVKQGDKAGGLFFDRNNAYEFAALGREQGVLRMLSALSRFSQQLEHMNEALEKNSFLDGLSRLKRVLRPGSLVIIISDFYQLDSHCEKQLNLLRKHHDLLLYHVCDPIELKAPKPALYPVTNGNHELMFDTTNPMWAQQYQQWCNQQQLRLQNLSQQLQVQKVLVTAQDDIPALVQQTYPRRKYA